MKSWVWEHNPSNIPGVSEACRLVDARGRNRCTVWKNGTWHTWDEHGTGGENDTAPDVRTAQEQATMAVIRQGWATLTTAKGQR